MNCHEARQRWHLRLDGDHVDSELRVHLDSCGVCREYADQMNEIVCALDGLRADTEHIVSVRTGAGLMEEVRKGHARWPIVLRTVSALAASIAIVVGASLYFAGRPTATIDEHGLRTPPSVARAELGLSLRGESAKRLMAVSAESAQSEVQMYWLYPTLASITGANGS